MGVDRGVAGEDSRCDVSETERLAWARLVNAVRDERDAHHAMVNHDAPGCDERAKRAADELLHALGALRDLGVDVDGYLEET